MKHQLSEPDREFLHEFESCKIEPSAFHHREHVRLAYSLLTLNDVSEARTRLKSSLLRFLSHNGVDLSVYHETMTVAWLLAVQHFMRRSKPARSWQDFIGQNRLLLDKEILFTHYSRDVLASKAAKAMFVEPDLDPIPVEDPGVAFG